MNPNRNHKQVCFIQSLAALFPPPFLDTHAFRRISNSGTPKHSIHLEGTHMSFSPLRLLRAWTFSRVQRDVGWVELHNNHVRNSHMGILSFTCRSTIPRNLEPLVKGHLIVPHMCIVNIPPSKPPPLCMPWVGIFWLRIHGLSMVHFDI